MSVVERLRQTSKGKLNYDGNWFTEGRLTEILDDIGRSRDEKYTTLHLPKAVLDKWAFLSDQKDLGGEERREVPSVTSLDVVGEVIGATQKNREMGTLNDFDKIELEIREYERQEKIKANNRFDEKRDEFSKFSHRLYEKSVDELRMRLERRRLLEEAKEQELAAKDEFLREEIDKRQRELDEKHESYVKMMDERFKEASLRDKRDEEEETQKRIELRDRISCLATSKQRISTTYQEIVSVVRSCKNLHLVPPDVRVAVQAMNEVVTSVQKVLDQIRAGNVQDCDVEQMKRLEEKTNDCLKIITAGVEHSAASAANVEPTVQSGLDTATPTEISVETSIRHAPPTEQAADESSVAMSVASSSSSNSSVSLKRYLALMENLNRNVEAYQGLATDANFKTYRFNLTKVINTNVNAISGQSGSHLRDKLDRLSRLLSGNHVEVSDRRISSGEHPQGKAFCFDLLSKKFVSHGEKQVSANHEAAFPIAMVVIGLWKQFPAFGDLFWAQLYIKCIYLVPYYVQRGETGSDVDHQSALGYNVVDGVLEEKDSFLKRMSGIVRLYAAIIQSSLPNGMQPPHPHGIEFAWMWLASILSLEPLADITATVLFDFLEVCGYSLQQTYGQQFQKVLIFVCQEYFPKIRAVTPAGSGGPITRLETFLQNYVVNGSISMPDGVLPPNFWFT